MFSMILNVSSSGTTAFVEVMNLMVRRNAAAMRAHFSLAAYANFKNGRLLSQKRMETEANGSGQPGSQNTSRKVYAENQPTLTESLPVVSISAPAAVPGNGRGSLHVLDIA